MRTKRAFWNMTSSMAYLLVHIICGFIVPRLILGAFGSAYNGVVSSANQYLNMISILNLGIAGPTRVALYSTIANDDLARTSGIVKATKKYMQKVGVAVICYTIVLMIILPNIIHSDLPRTEISLMIAIVAVSTFAQYSFAFTNQTLLSAYQADYITNIFNIVKVVANTILTAVLIFVGANIFVVKAGSAVIFFVCPLFLNYYVKTKYKLDSHCKPDYTSIKGRKAAVYHSVANIVHDNTDIILLTAFTDIKVVSVYTVYNLVANGLRNLMKIFANALESPFGALWAKKEYKKIVENFLIYEFGIYLFASVVFSCAYVLIIPFVTIYTKGINDINYVLPLFAFLIMTAELTYCIRQPYQTLVQASGNYEATKKDAILEATINIVVSIILIQFMGINGVLIGTLCANLVRTIRYAVFTENHILKIGYGHIFSKVLWTCINIVTSYLFSTFIIGFTGLSNNWISWIIKAIIVFVVTTIICLTTGRIFFRKEIQSFIAVLKRMVMRRRGA